MEKNQVARNLLDGAYILSGKTQLRHNHFTDNGGFGIRISTEGGGIFEANKLEGNEAGTKKIDTTAESNVQWKD